MCNMNEKITALTGTITQETGQLIRKMHYLLIDANGLMLSAWLAQF